MSQRNLETESMSMSMSIPLSFNGDNDFNFELSIDKGSQSPTTSVDVTPTMKPTPTMPAVEETEPVVSKATSAAGSIVVSTAATMACFVGAHAAVALM